jgi:quinoprotein glucose dehydrogenase
VKLDRRRIRMWSSIVALFFTAGIVTLRIVGAQDENKPQPRMTSAWPSYGNDPGGMRYATLTQISVDNVGKLELAWEYHTGDQSNGNRSDSPSTSAFEATPILVGGRLVFCTPFNRVIALDPLLGREVWPAPFDPKIDRTVQYENQLTCRGVSAWTDKSAGPDQKCVTRIFTGTNDGRLIAIDAQNGQKCDGFGQNGEINLRLEADVGRLRWKGEYQVTSPPAIAGDLVVVGSAIADNQRTDAPSGVVRAFDARSGQLKWAQDLVPGDYKGPRSEHGYALGSPNVWSIMSVDETLGLIYLPTGNPAPDFFHGQVRPPDDYGSSVVALQMDTGKIVWSFQTVHHDLWDYDVPAQPVLFTYYKEDGTPVPALAQATKTAHLFILNRQTGEPIFGVTEKPVPQSAVAGEQTSPTQPVPNRPAPLAGQIVTPESVKLSGCAKQMQVIRSDGIFSPPVIRGTVQFPGSGGGLNWSGVAIDPVRRLLITNSTNAAYQVRLFPAEDYEKEKRANPDGEVRPQDGTPYGMSRAFFTKKLLFGLIEIPCNVGPWGYLNAIDLRTGNLAWRTELGSIGNIKPIKGLPSLGGTILTSTGLAFIGSPIQDDRIRAFNVDTHQQLWEHKLPAGGQATPMTYEVEFPGGRKRQFVVIAAGGNGRARSKIGDSLVAFSLPEK